MTNYKAKLRHSMQMMAYNNRGINNVKTNSVNAINTTVHINSKKMEECYSG